MRKMVIKTKRMASVNEKEGNEFFFKWNLLHIYIIGLLMNEVYV